MTRRSVPRAVALGLFVGVIFPFMHFVIAAILAIPARANFAIAAAVAFVTGFAAPPLYYVAYHVGSWELHHDTPLVNPQAAAQFSSELSKMMFWVHHASGPIAIGIFTLAVIVASVGYLAASLVWGIWSRSRWERRRKTRIGS